MFLRYYSLRTLCHRHKEINKTIAMNSKLMKQSVVKQKAIKSAVAPTDTDTSVLSHFSCANQATYPSRSNIDVVRKKK